MLTEKEWQYDIKREISELKSHLTRVEEKLDTHIDDENADFKEIKEHISSIIEWIKAA